jgi:hypothetical protein
MGGKLVQLKFNPEARYATSPNRVYLASANAFAQIQPDGWTSDTLDTSSEMRLMKR